MRRFFIEQEYIQAGEVTIGGDEAHHIKDVIRLKAGDRFLGFDGAGRTYTLRITKLNDAVTAEIEKVSSRVSDMPKIFLACALPKKSGMDYIIEKATELGVTEIIPMVTERAVVKIDAGNKAAKQKRWERIALSASKQCGRASLPKVYEVAGFKDAIKLAGELGYRKKIMPCLCEGRKYINEALSGDIREAAIFIGPEGDFTKKEIDYAKERGFEAVSLGELVLKVETACIFAISVIQAKLFSRPL